LLYALFGENKEGIPNYNADFKLIVSEMDENSPNCAQFNTFNFGYQILYIRALRDAAEMADILYNQGYSTINIYGSSIKTDALRDVFNQYASNIEDGAEDKFYRSSLNVYVPFLDSDGTQTNYNNYAAPVVAYLGWFGDTFDTASPFHLDKPIVKSTWEHNRVNDLGASGLFGFPGFGPYANAFHWTMLMLMWGHKEGTDVNAYLNTVTSYLSPAMNYEIPENEVYDAEKGWQQFNSPLFWSEGAYLKLITTLYPLDGYMLDECNNLNSGQPCQFKLKSLAAGDVNLYYRAWDETINPLCSGNPEGYDRDPPSGTCSENCDTFPEDLIICDAYTETITVTPGA